MSVAKAGPLATMELVKRFEDSYNRHDPDALMADMTDDCVFEHVAPDGKSFGRFEGYEQVRGFWASLPANMPNYHFETEDVFATDDRCAYRWILTFDLPDGTQAVHHGVDIYTIRDGKISEKYTYASLL